MGSFSIWHWLIVLAVVLVLFGGGGKLSRLMGDFGKGLKSFRKNINDDSGSDNDDETAQLRSDDSINSKPKKSKKSKAKAKKS